MRHHVTKLLPYRPDELFALVGDVQAYPEFVPWLTAMRTWNHRPEGEGADSFDAEVQVGFSFLKERFATHVRRDAKSRIVDVGLLSGPFRKLENRWRFHEAPGGGTRVEFDIDFAFKSKLLEALLAANFHTAVERLMSCFEDRARALYPVAGASGEGKS